jgi:hypothetical protein
MEVSPPLLLKREEGVQIACLGNLFVSFLFVLPPVVV